MNETAATSPCTSRMKFTQASHGEKVRNVTGTTGSCQHHDRSMTRPFKQQMRDLSSPQLVLCVMHGQDGSVLQEVKQADLKASLVNRVGSAVKRLIDDDALCHRAWEHMRCATLGEVSETLCAAPMDHGCGLLLSTHKKIGCFGSRPALDALAERIDLLEDDFEGGQWSCLHYCLLLSQLSPLLSSSAFRVSWRCAPSCEAVPPA